MKGGHELGEGNGAGDQQPISTIRSAGERGGNLEKENKGLEGASPDGHRGQSWIDW